MGGRKKTHPMPPPSKQLFPIVGVGASAGGLNAFELFFAGFPKGKPTGMAFVLIQHLAPDHTSRLTELIRGFTHMKVFEIENGMEVRPECIYVIPPRHDLALLHGTLQLVEPTAPRGFRLPIDFFFRSLAQDQGESAIGVILSGMGSDGALGVRAIKEAGGMVMAQTPASTEFDGMPRSAIATDAVDFELPPQDLAPQLLAYVAHRGPRLAAVPAASRDSALKTIFVLLRAQTSHDFSQYKPSTIHRRLERRMAVHQIATIEDYLKFLQHTKAEVEAFFRDLLIGVTNFFRDPAAFKALEEAIPQLFAGKQPGSRVRVWVAGCSTGEEAYSIAILLAEHVAALKEHYILQVFATDLDSRAIATARQGHYPLGAVSDVSPERLARFFTADPGGQGYRINKAVRDLLIFSEQDLLKDPPFSKLDLLSCRNVLIYLGPELQKKLIPLFFYALKQDGLLFLGTSEGVGDFDVLFSAVDRKAKLYSRKPEVGGRRLSLAPSLLADAVAVGAPAPPGKAGEVMKLSAREVMELALVQHLAPPSALVSAQGDIMYLHGRAGLFLEPASGEASVNNILKMAREGLRPSLATALQRSSSTQKQVRLERVRVKTNGHFTTVNVTVVPVVTVSPPGAPPPPLYLVLMEEAPFVEPTTPPGEVATPETVDARVEALRQELRAKEEHLQATNEELESSAEELKSSNEEMQSVNEELQSTNEELETSKEELQSVNEELATVNTELQTKVFDLSRANNDINNLLAGTGIGTVFVNHQLRILRFTPAASAITNLIQSDVGRPVGHIVSNLVGYDRLVPDAQEVLDTLRSKEVDVQTTSGRWFTLRMQPYRTVDNVIEGVVMSFTDITETVRVRESLRKVNEVLRLAVVVRDAHDAITVQDLEGRTLAWNPGASRLYGWSEPEALLLNVRDRIPLEEQAKERERLERLRRGELIEPYRSRRINKAGLAVEVAVVSTALINEVGATYAIATTERPSQPSSKRDEPPARS